jgi:hypothetical protein
MAPLRWQLHHNGDGSIQAETELVSAAMGRVDSFLGELRGTLVDLANRPQAQSVDMQPFVNAVGEFGQRVEHGVAIGIHAALNSRSNTSRATAMPAQSSHSQGSSSNIILLGFAFLTPCWSAIFWFKTGSASPAIGTLVGANLLACCLFAGRRS